MSRNKKKRKPPSAPRLPVPIDQIAAIVERTKGALSAADHSVLKSAVDSLAAAMDIIDFMTSELQANLPVRPNDARVAMHRLAHCHPWRRSANLSMK